MAARLGVVDPEMDRFLAKQAKKDRLKREAHARLSLVGEIAGWLESNAVITQSAAAITESGHAPFVAALNISTALSTALRQKYGVRAK